MRKQPSPPGTVRKTPESAAGAAGAEDLSFADLDFDRAAADEIDEIDEIEYEEPREFDDSDIERATRHQGGNAFYNPAELFPLELADLDLSAFDIVNVPPRGGGELFLGLYLTNTAEAYGKTGVGVYECVLRFPFRRPVNDEDVQQYFGRCRAMLSRLRKSVRTAEFFYLALLEYEILPDLKHVAVQTARMAPGQYGVWIGNKRAEANMRRSGMIQLKDML